MMEVTPMLRSPVPETAEDKKQPSLWETCEV